MTSPPRTLPDPAFRPSFRRSFRPSFRSFGLVNAVVTVCVLSFLVWVVYLREGTPGHAAASSTTLPALNAFLNGLSAALIIAGRVAIQNRRRRLHATLMIAAVVASACFVTSYVYYHLHHGDTPFPGTGWIRPVYFTILISHILTSAVAFPMILTSLFLAFSGRLATHRRVSRYTWLAWLYVSVTGVVVFFMLY
jgi:putative membrane protein